MKLWFFERDNLDPYNSEPVAIEASLGGEVSKLLTDYKDQFVSADTPIGQRTLNFNVLYLNFLKGASGRGLIKKTRLVTGERGLSYSVQNQVLLKNIDNVFNVKLDKTLLESSSSMFSESDSNIDTSFNTESFSLEQTTYNPAFYIEIAGLFYRFSEGLSDYSQERLDVNLGLEINKLLGFQTYLRNRTSRVLGPNFILNVGSRYEEDQIDKLDNIRQVNKQIGASNRKFTKTERRIYDIKSASFIDTDALTQDTEVNITADVFDKYSIKRPSLYNNRILLPAKREIEVVSKGKTSQSLSNQSALVDKIKQTATDFDFTYTTSNLTNYQNSDIDVKRYTLTACNVRNVYRGLVSNLIPSYVDERVSRFLGLRKLRGKINNDYIGSPVSLSNQLTIPLSKLSTVSFNVLIAKSSTTDTTFVNFVKSDPSDAFIKMLFAYLNFFQGLISFGNEENLTIYLDPNDDQGTQIPAFAYDSNLTGEITADKINTELVEEANRYIASTNPKFEIHPDSDTAENQIKADFITTSAQPISIRNDANLSGNIRVNGSSNSAGAVPSTGNFSLFNNFSSNGNTRFGYFPLITYNIPSSDVMPVINPRSPSTINLLLQNSNLVFSGINVEYRITGINQAGRFQISKSPAGAPNPVFSLEISEPGKVDRFVNINASVAGSVNEFIDQPSLNRGGYTYGDFANYEISNETDLSYFVRPAKNITIGIAQSSSVTRFIINEEREDRLEQEARDRARLKGEKSPDLLANPPSDFPFINVNQLRYQSNKLKLYLSRKTNEAPVPSDTFFDSLTINDTEFNFSDAVTQVFLKDDDNNPFEDLNVKEYAWDASFDPTREDAFLSFILKKSGRSVGSEFSAETMIRKSSVQTTEDKTIPTFVNGIEILGFDFTTTQFQVTIREDRDFACMRVLDKTGEFRITRDLRPADATKSIVLDRVTYTWNNLPEFKTLKENKDYNLEIIKGKTTNEPDFFVPHYDQLGALPVFKRDGNDLQINFSDNGYKNFSSLLVLNSNGSVFLDVINENRLLGDFPNYTFKNAFSAIKNPVLGSSYQFKLLTEALGRYELKFTKLTDLFVDCIVFLNSNVSDVHLQNMMDENLIHPSDIRQKIEVVEKGIRSFIVFLNNPVTTKQLKLSTFFNSDTSLNRKIGKILLLKTIGTFDQYPRIKPVISNDKVETKDLFNTSYVKSKLTSRNYEIEIQPTKDIDKLKLIANLFSRVSDWNEFIIWANGGDSNKGLNLEGFRVVDFVKSLCINDFEYEFVDGFFQNGASTIIQTSEVQ